MGFFLVAPADAAGADRELELLLVETDARDALQALDRAILNSPRDLPARNLRNRVRVGQGELAAVIGELHAAAVAAPEDPLPWLQLAVLPIAHSDRVAAALAARDRAPTSLDARRTVIEAYSYAGRLDEAERELITDPGLPRAVRERLEGALSVLRADFERAIPTLESATKNDPHDADAFRWLAEACRRSRRWIEAERAIERAIFLGPARAENHVTAARLELDRGRPRRAVERCRRGLAVEPNHAELQEVLIRSQLALRDREGAQSTLDQLSVSPSVDASTRLELACEIAWEARAALTLAHRLDEWSQLTPAPSQSQRRLHRGRLAYLQEDLATLREIVHTTTDAADKEELAEHLLVLADTIERRSSRTRFVSWTVAVALVTLIALGFTAIRRRRKP